MIRDKHIRQRGLREKFEKGSFTVEASVIVPMIFIITAALIILTFFVHNRNYYLAAGLETALVGNSRYITNGKEDLQLAQLAAEQRASDRVEGQPFPGSLPEKSVTCTPEQTEVSFSGQRFSMFPRELFEWSVDVTVERVRPVKVIRLTRAGKHLIQSMKDPEKESE